MHKTCVLPGVDPDGPLGSQDSRKDCKMGTMKRVAKNLYVLIKQSQNFIVSCNCCPDYVDCLNLYKWQKTHSYSEC